MTESQKEATRQVIETLVCPICYLAMAGMNREPMVLPCGHSYCKQCLTHITSCPLCSTPFSKATRNISLLQIAEIMNSSGLIPDEFNPPPPKPITWVKPIQPVCTFAATEDKYIEQDWYQCVTCGISGSEGFCSTCKDICHKGHDVIFMRRSQGFFCDCGANSRRCKCLPRHPNQLVCTNSILSNIPSTQPMYQCNTCHIDGNSFICQNCAIRCHHRHDLIYYPSVKNVTCSCIQHCACSITTVKPLCTFALHGDHYIHQKWYHCNTCGLTGNLGCCEICASTCHKGHFLEYSGISHCYCDCGAGERGLRCKNLKRDGNYLNTCSDFLEQVKSRPQREYSCQTCTLANSICEGCAINCHVNHTIQYIGMRTFECSCKNTNQCIAMSSPPLHHHTTCFNHMIRPTDTRPKYVCNTCSPNTYICEACALKCHDKHDFHLVDYSCFQCQCMPCSYCRIG